MMNYCVICYLSIPSNILPDNWEPGKPLQLDKREIWNFAHGEHCGGVFCFYFFVHFK